MRIFSRMLYLVLLAVLLHCQEGPQEYIKEHEHEVLTIVSEGVSLPADGKSALKIAAFIPDNADLKTVNFTTTNGKFRFSDSMSYTVDATAIDNRLRAEAFLISGTEMLEDVLIKVTVSAVDTVLHVEFTTALADSISNESAVASIKRGYDSNVTVKTILFRRYGKPSLHQKVTFEAFRADKKPIGEFMAISLDGSDKDGIVNSTFVLKDTVYTGPLKIVSRYQGAKMYTDTLLVFVTNK